MNRKKFDKDVSIGDIIEIEEDPNLYLIYTRCGDNACEAIKNPTFVYLTKEKLGKIKLANKPPK